MYVSTSYQKAKCLLAVGNYCACDLFVKGRKRNDKEEAIKAARLHILPYPSLSNVHQSQLASEQLVMDPGSLNQRYRLIFLTNPLLPHDNHHNVRWLASADIVCYNVTQDLKDINRGVELDELGPRDN
jgi:hypothetical protein